ncbi:MAG: choice-of-anchor D domain-containing protein [bacterium]
MLQKKQPQYSSIRAGATGWRIRRHVPLLVLVCSLIIIGALALVYFGPRTALTADKNTAEWTPQISPMGAIARGDEPIPKRDDLIHPSGGPAMVSRAPAGIQGNDQLVHSPMAIDFQSETTIAKNGDFVVVGFNDVRGFYLPNVSVSGYAYSSDGGATWTDGYQLPTAGGASAVYGDPDVKTWTDPGDSQVYFFYSSLYTNISGRSSLCIHVSTDGGATWVGPREVTTATSLTDFPDKEFMDVDPETGRIFVSWTNFGSSTSMRITYSDDMGLSWNGPTVFSSNVGQGSVPRTDGQSDNMYLAWRRSSDIQLCRSTDNGVNWTGPTTIRSGLSNPMNPYGSDRIAGFVGMDVDDNNGNVYITYASRNLSPDFSDIYFIKSTNGGLSWSSPVAINSDPGNDRAQFFNWNSVDQTDGRIDVMWYSQVNGTGTSDLTDVYHTHSYDEGATWTCPTPLTDKPFHAEYGNTTSQPNIGDYNQCVSDNGKLYVSFAKTGPASYQTYAPDTYVDISDATPPDAPIRYSSAAFTETGCTSGNGYIESGETVSLVVTIQNSSDCIGSINGIQAQLTTSTPGVSVMIDVDPSFACGDDIDLLIDINSTAGLARIPFAVHTGVPSETGLLSENFDGVSAPALPPGWSTSTFSGASNPWKTSTTYSASGPNAAFCADYSSTSGNRLTSPSIVIPANSNLVDVTFDITHNLEHLTERRAWDGALLRIQVDDGSVHTLLAGAFASLFDPFYPWQIERSSSSTQPLQDLSCWSSNVTPNFNSVHLQFPGLAGTTIKLLFDLGTDSNTGTSSGMFVDNVVVKSIEKTCQCTDAPTVAVSPAPIDFSPVPVNTTVCDTVYIINEGPTTLTIDGIYGCTNSPFSLDTTMTAHSVPAGDSTSLAVCVTPESIGPFNCTITVVSNAANGPTTIPVSLDIVTAVGDGARRLPFRIVSVAPNPFNPSTTVRFSLPERMPVTAEVWSVTGARVRVLASNRTKYTPDATGALASFRPSHRSWFSPAANVRLLVKITPLAKAPRG